MERLVLAEPSRPGARILGVLEIKKKIIGEFPVESVDDSNEASRSVANGNPHVLWRQVTGLVLWVGIFSYFGGGPVWAVIGLILASVTFADAWASGIYKDPSKQSFFNISPMAWGIAMALLFIVAYPSYLINRNKLRTQQAGNAYFVATIILGAAVVVLIVMNFVAAGTAAVS